jgi:hypothetical protein
MLSYKSAKRKAESCVNYGSRIRDGATFQKTMPTSPIFIEVRCRHFLKMMAFYNF